jgi:hypothetical protein
MLKNKPKALTETILRTLDKILTVYQQLLLMAQIRRIIISRLGPLGMCLPFAMTGIMNRSYQQASPTKTSASHSALFHPTWCRPPQGSTLKPLISGKVSETFLRSLTVRIQTLGATVATRQPVAPPSLRVTLCSIPLMRSGSWTSTQKKVFQALPQASKT